MKSTLGSFGLMVLLSLSAAAQVQGVPQPADATAEVNAVKRRVFAGLGAEPRGRLEGVVRVYVVPQNEGIEPFIERIYMQTLDLTTAQRQIIALQRAYDERYVEPGNRTPQDPRGFSILLDGKQFVFVGSENMTSTGAWDPNGSRSRRVLVHELGHAVFNVGLSEAGRAEFAVQHEEALLALGHHHDAVDDSEFFAEMTEIWFGVHQTGLRQAGRTAQDLQRLAPNVYRMLQYVYGEPLAAGAVAAR